MNCLDGCNSIWQNKPSEILKPFKKKLPDKEIKTIFKRKLPFGKGDCPNCGGKTVLKEGIYGKFYGCSSFPRCMGSRNYSN